MSKAVAEGVAGLRETRSEKGKRREKRYRGKEGGRKHFGIHLLCFLEWG